MSGLRAIVPALALLAIVAMIPIPSGTIGHMTYLGGGDCSAFAVGPGGFWATATHCLSEPPDVMFVNGAEVTKVLDSTPGMNGISIIRVVSKASIPYLRVGPKPKPGDDVIAVGHGGGSPMPLLYKGLFVGPGPLAGEALDFHTAGVMSGMSGGPLLNTSNQIVGMITGAYYPTDFPVGVGFGPSYDEVARLIHKYAPSRVK